MTTGRAVLCVNTGSSSVKYGLFTFEPSPRTLGRGSSEVSGPGRAPTVLEWAERQRGSATVAAIGHRIVHGGPHHCDPQRVDDALLNDLRTLIPFAPNHLPDELSLIETIGQAWPGVPQFVCFDTSFHHDLPEVARRLPIPDKYNEAGVRRYGFHGLSFAFLLEELERIAGRRAAEGNVVLAHLGNGSSLAAVSHGHCIDTSMGFTPLGGVVMSTRSGDLDPGIVTYIARSEGFSPDQIEDLLSHHAGLVAISGVSSDMRELLAHEHTSRPCALAIAIYCYQIRKWIGAFAAALGGLDTLVFAGGIGEHSAPIRARICDGLQFLGIDLDADANRADASVISRTETPLAVRVIPTDEELMIARAAYTLHGAGDP
ncbi:MAG TPA: acetate/propionate family kinase [Vicinamibacterales bacterium]